MNDRIERIIDQAYIELQKTQPDRFYGQRTVARKVAELVALECSRLIEYREPRTEPIEHIYILKEFGL